MKAEKVGFIPHSECTLASGDCFTHSQCLMKCRPRLPAASANQSLGAALRLLKELTAFTISSRECTKYVNDSTIDLSVKQAKALLEKHK